jgi:hypothetical protein
MTEPSNATAAASPTPPDHPSVPRAHRSIWTKVVIGFAVIVLGGYTAVAFTQRELRDVEKDEIPGSVRSSPGGYRSYSFWHSGYHGGK